MSGWKIKKVELGRIYENLDLGRLKQWTLEGRVDRADEILRPGQTSWVAAGDVAELASYFVPTSTGGGTISGHEFDSSFRSHADDDTLELDMTPIIDCTFLLLLFFVVTAQFTHRGLQIHRPETEAGENLTQNSLTVQVDREGRIFFDGKEVTAPMLKRSLEARMAETKRKSLIIDGDKDAPHGIIVQIMDQARLAGIEDCKFPTKIKGGGE